MNKILLIIFISLLQTVQAEPWLDTRDPWLRADIEALSANGIINTPITTWPLPWARILKDIDNAQIDQVPAELMPSLMRVKRKGRIETSKKTRSELALRAGNEGKILRHFGDSRREQAEISTRNTGMSKSFAWNIEVTKAHDPFNGEEDRLDNSYVAAIWGNWIVSAGAQERWYGPGWDSSLILSNNARPVPSLSIQRNYADPFESEWLSWIGPWSVSAFAGQLESDRFIPHAKLLGMSVTFKPFDSLEIGLRRTAQWGGEGRPESLSNFWDLLIGRDNCDELEGGCSADRSNEPGNQLAGVDFNWRLPAKMYYGTVYGQFIGEDEAGYAPSRKVYQFGYMTNFQLSGMMITSYLEYADTENEFRPNLTYNNYIYRSGYRTEGRSIGSTYDNDSQSTSIGMIASHKNGDRYKVRLVKVDMNSDGGDGNHTINNQSVSFKQIELEYQHPTKYGILGVDFDYKDKSIDSFGYQDNRYNIAVNWTMEL
ncbi:capsule assembly Wzi family protein [Kangiella sediminilitoris]|uniref:Capsule assembly Wzi family protein n=1 Tax=Kangiella sediminilitoris TaxID=1144748 RepID=A0A1B3BBK6_9GAMM|nr:capsule assembly Wzi family protein [Kangiella sediminilitoris]AOE50170.1 hypothetical protein KS2013_1458 [Kangiella sediminilitoris]